MEQILQQSSGTAAYRRLYFHLVDATDGITAETGVTGTGMISKNGGAAAATTNNIVEIDAADQPGCYYIELTAAELSDLGRLLFYFKSAATAKAVALGAVVAYDPFAAPASTVDANVVQISGDSGAADNLESACDGTGYNLGGGSIVAASVTGNVGGNVGGNVTGSVGSVAAGGITAASLAADAITAAKVAADVGTEIAAAVQTSAAASPLPADIKKVNNVTVNGDGSGTPWGP